MTPTEKAQEYASEYTQDLQPHILTAYETGYHEGAAEADQMRITIQTLTEYVNKNQI